MLTLLYNADDSEKNKLRFAVKPAFNKGLKISASELAAGRRS